MNERDPIVITGIGLAAPNGSSRGEYRAALLQGRSGVVAFETRHLGIVPAGVCEFDEFQYQRASVRRKGTRAGSVAIYCARQALQDSQLDWPNVAVDRVGICLGITEHGNVETENQIHELGQYNNDLGTWSNYHNSRTVANNPAGEVSINLGITGPHLTIGAACAAGNAGLIHGAQLLTLGEIDVALAGGVSESIRSFGIFASFHSQRALARHDDPAKASRPFDLNRNGIVVSEGGGVFVLERLSDAQRRHARIYAEIAGYAMNSDARDLVNPFSERQRQCMELALRRAGIDANEVSYLGTHATGTDRGDAVECESIQGLFGDRSGIHITNTKSLIGHTMGAAGAMETAALLSAFEDGLIHPTINLDDRDPQCDLKQFVTQSPRDLGNFEYGMVNSFGMLGINSTVVLRRPRQPMI